MKFLKYIFILCFISVFQSCNAQQVLINTESNKLNQLIESIDSDNTEHEIFKSLDTYIQNHELTSIEARLMSEKLFNSEATAAYELLIKYNSKFTRPGSKNASEIISGKVFIIHAEVTRLGIIKIKPFADYIYNSKLEKKLNEGEIDFYRLVLMHFAELYYKKYILEKSEFSKVKNSNLMAIFKAFER